MRPLVKRLVRTVLPPRAISAGQHVFERVRPPGLSFLAARYRSDKGWRHNYTAVYPIHFQTRRRRVRKVLEVGVGGYADPQEGGASLRMWRDYFPKAEIIGVDIHPKRITEDRIRVELCDQGDPAALAALAERHGPFDIVIDDGSHIGRHTWATFEALYDAVVERGIYVIEDLHTSYDETFEGGEPGMDGTGVALVKALVDRMHVGDAVGRIDVHQGIAFVHKGQSLSVALDRWGHLG